MPNFQWNILVHVTVTDWENLLNMNPSSIHLNMMSTCSWYHFIKEYNLQLMSKMMQDGHILHFIVPKQILTNASTYKISPWECTYRKKNTYILWHVKIPALFLNTCHLSNLTWMPHYRTLLLNRFISAPHTNTGRRVRNGHFL
jgi:hypothetical protein